MLPKDLVNINLVLTYCKTKNVVIGWLIELKKLVVKLNKSNQHLYFRGLLNGIIKEIIYSCEIYPIRQGSSCGK